MDSRIDSGTPNAAFPVPITESWLRDIGFRFEQVQNERHWLLWLGETLGPGHSADDLGIELAAYRDHWNCWIRADYCGKYTRFIHLRMIRSSGELCALIEALIGQKLNVSHIWFGSLKTEKGSEWMKNHCATIHVKMAMDWGKRVERDEGRDPADAAKLNR